MAIQQTEVEYGGIISSYVGLSTDTKPTSCGVGSTFLELDTQKVYIYSPANINVTSAPTGWWAI